MTVRLPAFCAFCATPTRTRHARHMVPLQPGRHRRGNPQMPVLTRLGVCVTSERAKLST